jgi:hypothetical protein
MNILRYFIILVLSLISCVGVFATTTATVKGCMINSQAFIYTQYLGSYEYQVNQYYKPKFDTYSQSSTAEYRQEWYNENNCPHFQSYNIGSSQCAVQGITYANSNGVQNLGLTVTYTLDYTGCEPNVGVPLDDYVWVILLFAGLMGAIMLVKGNSLYLKV